MKHQYIEIIEMFLKTVVFYTCVAMASTVLTISLSHQKPEKYKNVEGCYVTEMDVVIPYGTSVHSKKDCMEHRCDRDALHTLTCPIAMYDFRDRPNCYIFEDHKKPYPGCCPQINCPAKPDSPKKT